MNIYKWAIDIPEGNIKKGMTICWNKDEQEYTTVELPEIISPLMSLKEVNQRIKLGQVVKSQKIEK